MIVGGGISGLSLAAWLKKSGMAVLVLEKSDHPGGVIGSIEADGFLFERGPNTILDKSAAFNELLNLAGMEDQTVRAPLKSQNRYIWRDNRLHIVPTGPLSLIRSSLLSFGAKCRLAREAWISPVDADETLKDFVVRRLGKEIYHRAFLPMVQGIWAGDPAQMSARASFPTLKEFEADHRSVIRGFFSRMKTQRATSKDGASSKETHLVSFQKGIAQLTDSLADFLGDSYRPEAEVCEIMAGSDSGGFQITGRLRGKETVFRAKLVILSSETQSAGKLIEHFEPELASRLKAIPYCPLICVGLGVEVGDLKIPSGFGFLVARDQGLRILGTIFNSNIFPGRAPAGCAALTVMLGGDLDPSAINLSDEEILKVVRHDLGFALDWNGKAKAIHIERWNRAIPRYGMDYFEVEALIEGVERRHPGLHFFGNWRQGVSINDRIELARTQAQKISVVAGRPS